MYLKSAKNFWNPVEGEHLEWLYYLLYFYYEFHLSSSIHTVVYAFFISLIVY